jgi:hypothetical protein
VKWEAVTRIIVDILKKLLFYLGIMSRNNLWINKSFFASKRRILQIFFFNPLYIILFIFISFAATLAGELKLAWDPNAEPDLAGYIIYYGTAPLTFDKSVDVKNVTTYTLTDLDLCTHYYIVATAYDSFNNISDYSNEVDGFAEEPPPAAIVVSPAGTITTTTPTYTWNAVCNSTWYYLWVNDSTGNPIQQWYTASAAGCGSGTGICSVTPATALALGSASWWIQTRNGAGTGPWSSALSFTVSLPPPPAATLVSPSGTITTATPTYIWNAVPGSTYYYLSVNDSTGSRILQWYTASQAGCGSGTGTCSVAPSTVLAAGAGQWKVQTYNTSGLGPWSVPMSFMVMVDVSAPPPAATLISPSGTVSTMTPTYTWNAVSTALDYLLWVNDSTGNPIQQWYTASAAGCGSGTGICSVTPATALALGSASWWIQTRNGAGTGPWSSALSFRVSL